MQKQTLDWICKYFKKEQWYSERSLWIKYDKCEFNILVAFTYERQKYYQFNFKGNKQYLRLFNSEEVEKIAYDLMSSYNQYKNAIQDAQIQNHKYYIAFLNQNMSTVFTILRTYHIREERVGTETRLAILVLKAWKYYLLRRKMVKSFIEDVSIEMFCVYAKDLIVKDQQRQQQEEKKYDNGQKKEEQEITLLDVIQQFLSLLVYIGEHVAMFSPGMLMWPHQRVPIDTLITPNDIEAWIKKQTIII
ncbi:hypothetical protein RFI_31985 [Reticulomyxa filosa]|uniref:Uncharacterized protein n=1 Tax=Reticulomyxa filosa TaxID=46433 RepID=X6LWA0_RETFI|nr:hypothetical protein RFI_31985 [Reticulomyxa filosa]|eukprot:ETO05412.1 hypothetical protein RFI_31985 [Reticulomyxa filosa]